MGQVEFRETIEARGGPYALHGVCDEKFAPVFEAFRQNFEQEEELGAACSVVIDGETVVDLWGGWARADRSLKWDAHTTVCMMSVAKGVTGICFNMAIDRRLIDPAERIATYWPEFAQNGKEDILVRMALDHTAGIPVLTDDVMQPGGFFDYEGYIRALEVQHPLWQPGTRAAYHVHNQGFLLGEILRRVTGQTVGPFLKENVTKPLGAEYYIGNMDEQQQAHVAEVLPNTGARLFAAKDAAVPDKPTTPEGWQDGAVLRSFAFLQNPAEPLAISQVRHTGEFIVVCHGSAGFCRKAKLRRTAPSCQPSGVVGLSGTAASLAANRRAPVFGSTSATCACCCSSMLPM